MKTTTNDGQRLNPDYSKERLFWENERKSKKAPNLFKRVIWMALIVVLATSIFYYTLGALLSADWNWMGIYFQIK